MADGWLVTHANCLDGATAALVGVASGLSPIFVEPDRVEEGIRSVTDPRPIYLADVSVRASEWPTWGPRVAHLLDHHQTAAPLSQYPNVTIDQTRSGAHLMYDYAVSQNWIAPSPAWRRLIDAVQRYDLWKPDHEAGQNLNRLFQQLGWEWYRDRFHAGWVPLIPEEGQVLAEIIRDEAAFIHQHVSKAQRHTIPDGPTIAGVLLNAEGPVNEVCHTLLTQGVGLVVVVKPDGRLSARSNAPIDAAHLMETLFHGGGHARAAGGRLPENAALTSNTLASILAQMGQELSQRLK